MWVGPTKLGWAEIDPTKLTLLGGGLGWKRSSPPPKLIIYITWIIVHVLHAAKMVAENAGWRRSLDRDQEVELVVWVALLGGVVAGVVHGEKGKTLAEVRERNKQWLFQVWGWPTGGWASYMWWSWWWRSWWWLWLVAGMAERERERERNCRNEG
jgi:hypothetical protein